MPCVLSNFPKKRRAWLQTGPLLTIGATVIFMLPLLYCCQGLCLHVLWLVTSQAMGEPSRGARNGAWESGGVGVRLCVLLFLSMGGAPDAVCAQRGDLGMSTQNVLSCRWICALIRAPLRMY